MADPFRNVRMNWHRLVGTKVMTLDGVRIGTAAPGLSPLVRNLIFKRTYEDAERDLLRRCLRPGDRVLEIGGGIGVVGLVAARIAGAGRVTSYEANPGLEPILRANYALNPVTPELRMKAVTADGAPATFHVADNVVSSSLLARDEATREVTVKSDALPAVLAELEPDVLVMDIEGAETTLLPAADLSALRAIVVELHPHIVGQEAVDGLLATLAEQGFEVAARARTNVLMERR
ncbi:FkbM family methyltransferase [Rhodobacterales bacterium HKCCE2091]|nr:FkbM family methyltransferase [Rhodobacterales bacterium HKCCE2091]